MRSTGYRSSSYIALFPASPFRSSHWCEASIDPFQSFNQATLYEVHPKLTFQDYPRCRHLLSPCKSRSFVSRLRKADSLFQLKVTVSPPTSTSIQMCLWVSVEIHFSSRLTEVIPFIAIVKHLHPEASDSISNCQLGIPANNHVTVSFIDAGIPNSLDVTLDPPIKDVSDGYKRILALRNEAWLALGVVSWHCLLWQTDSRE